MSRLPGTILIKKRILGFGTLILILVGALILILVSGCKSFSVDESYMFPSFGLGQTVPDGATMKEHRFSRPDGSEVYGMSVVLDPNQPSVLYYGGNNQSVDNSMSRVVSNFADMNLNVFFFDRRGQGRNSGAPGVDTAFEDAKAVFAYVQARVDGPLILHGLSLGGFEAAAVAATHPVDALVLEATATNVDDFVEHAIPWYAKPFIRVKVDDVLRGFDNRDQLKEYNGPLLLLAGENDGQTAPALMEKLYRASPSEVRRLTIVENAYHHNVMSQIQAREIYREFLVASDLLASEDSSG